MNLRLSIRNDELDEERLLSLSREISSSINNETDGEARLIEEESKEGIKGDAISIGELALTFLSSGAAVALFNLLKSYFDRHKQMEITLEREDGRKFSVNAQNISQEQISRTITLAEDFLGK